MNSTGLSNSITDHNRVIIVHGDQLMSLCSKIPNIQNRASIVHCLIKAYKLLESARTIGVTPASVEHLCKFHSSLYIDFLQKISDDYSSTMNENKDSIEAAFSGDIEHFGIGYDCPIVDDISKLVSLVAGSSICAAKELCQDTTDIAINWFGGWHHAQRDYAEGFCYINDIVLAIEELRSVFSRILYIDLDVHHGNGVENAFNFSRKVFTLSFHQYETGFYPGTGSVDDIGVGRGKYYTVNVPLKEGISDNLYCYTFKKVASEVMAAYQPDVVVVQCGADGLTGDRLGGFNLTLTSYGYCLKQILSWKKPTLILGGGGYSKANVARCWTYLTSIVVGRLISNSIPDNKYFSEFGPDFTLNISPSNRKDYNSKEYLKSMLHKIICAVRENVSAS